MDSSSHVCTWTTGRKDRTMKVSSVLMRCIYDLSRQREGSELRSCVKVGVDVLGSLSLIVFTVSVDVKQHSTAGRTVRLYLALLRRQWWGGYSSTLAAGWIKSVVYASNLHIVQELCENRGGRPGLAVLTSLMVSVDVKLYWTMLTHWSPFVPNMSTDIRGH